MESYIEIDHHTLGTLNNLCTDYLESLNMLQDMSTLIFRPYLLFVTHHNKNMLVVNILQRNKSKACCVIAPLIRTWIDSIVQLDMYDFIKFSKEVIEYTNVKYRLVKVEQKDKTYYVECMCLLDLNLIH
jgi:hypothetical protein